MSDLQPAGTAERAGMLFAELRAWKDDSEKRGIPEIIAEIHRDRLWLALNYPTWEAACDAVLGGLRVQLPRGDRREVVGQLRDEGLSQRAIGAALGVHHSTVADDLATVGNPTVDEPVTVKSLDGKDRTYTRKPVTHIHLDPDDDVPDDEVAAVEADLRSYIDGSADVRAANLRAGFSKWLHAMSQSHLYDPEEIAVIYPDRVADVRFIADQISKWAATYEAEASQPLRVIKGNGR